MDIRMADEKDNEVVLQQLVHSVLELQGLLSASNTILHSLVSIICAKAPELIDELKEKITDVAELKVKMELESNISITSFQNEVAQSLRYFDLYKQASTHSHTYIEVKDKK